MIATFSRPRVPEGRGSRVPQIACFATACLLAVTSLPSASSQETAAGKPADVAAIRAASAAYAAALARGDAEAVRAAWTADGDVVDGWGNRTRAREIEIEEGASSEPAAHRPETRLRFLSADVAIEDGTVDVVLPGTQTRVDGWFSALWVRSDEGWKLAGLRESERPVVADADMLEELDWLVGDWVLDVDEKAIEEGDGRHDIPPATRMSVRWDEGRAFLVRDVRVPLAANDAPAGFIDVHQRIGWDPVVRRVRSWGFSSDGSRSEATLFRDGDSWVAVQTVFLPDGRQESTTNVYSPDGPEKCVWRIMPEAFDADAGRPTRVVWVRQAKEGGR